MLLMHWYAGSIPPKKKESVNEQCIALDSLLGDIIDFT